MRIAIMLLLLPFLSGCFADTDGVFSPADGERILPDGTKQVCFWPEIEDRICGPATFVFDKQTGRTLLSFQDEIEWISLHFIADSLFVARVPLKGSQVLMFGETSESAIKVAYIKCSDLIDSESSASQNFAQDSVGACAPKNHSAFAPMIGEIRALVRGAQGESLAAIIDSDT